MCTLKYFNTRVNVWLVLPVLGLWWIINKQDLLFGGHKHKLSEVAHTPAFWTADTPPGSSCRLWRWGGWCSPSRVTSSWTLYQEASVWGRSKEKRPCHGAAGLGEVLTHTRHVSGWLTSNCTSGLTRRRRKSERLGLWKSSIDLLLNRFFIFKWRFKCPWSYFMPSPFQNEKNRFIIVLI